jgi:toxin-antitoxin system PIN domain toxin
MKAIDTNVLVYAHRADSPFHEQASTVLRTLAEGPAQWAIPWSCVYEFYAVVTHPRIYSPPSSPDQALDQLRAWIESPTCVLLAEPSGHWRRLEQLLHVAALSGPAVHDARIASICIAHGVTELLTYDRDFSRFPDLHCTRLI